MISETLAGLTPLSRVLDEYNKKLQLLNEQYPLGGATYEAQLRKLDSWFKVTVEGDKDK